MYLTDGEKLQRLRNRTFYFLLATLIIGGVLGYGAKWLEPARVIGVSEEAFNKGTAELAANIRQELAERLEAAQKKVALENKFFEIDAQNRRVAEERIKVRLIGNPAEAFVLAAWVAEAEKREIKETNLYSISTTIRNNVNNIFDIDVVPVLKARLFGSGAQSFLMIAEHPRMRLLARMVMMPHKERLKHIRPLLEVPFPVKDASALYAESEKTSCFLAGNSQEGDCQTSVAFAAHYGGSLEGFDVGDWMYTVGFLLRRQADGGSELVAAVQKAGLELIKSLE